ncbi:MAG: carboxypeptidase regulatory-like domain-containing protein [Armatimonadetes bacterium]|nr:carboxypeptidase regulatory-like domain-containing protein [Armatimonadota bacterium]
MSATPPRPPDAVEALLRRVKRWLLSAPATLLRHPDNASLAAHLDWLGEGAPGACPLPAVAEHVAACPECYRKVEDLLIAHEEAARAALRPRASFLLHLERRLETGFVEWVGAAGVAVRMPLAGRAPDLPRGLAVADARGGIRAPDPAPPAIPLGELEARILPRPGESDFELTIALTRAGRAAPGLRVRLSEADGPEVREGETDRDGRAVFAGVPPRSYRIHLGG